MARLLLFALLGLVLGFSGLNPEAKAQEDTPSVSEFVTCVSNFGKILRVREDGCRRWEFEVDVEGAVGPEGPEGPQGEQGVAGVDGATGPQGPEGPAGATGPEGPAGPSGADGAQGPEGPQGPQGDPGSPGNDGGDGNDGADGFSNLVKTIADPDGVCADGGTRIDTGLDDGDPGGTPNDGILDNAEIDETFYACNGAQGPEGPQGDQGIQGLQGLQGMKGDTGDTGPEGPQGMKGDKGDTGDPGPEGAQGMKGDTGDTGPEGPEGPPADTTPLEQMIADLQNRVNELESNPGGGGDNRQPYLALNCFIYTVFDGNFPDRDSTGVPRPYLGEIMFAPYNFAPAGWVPCDGQILSVSQNQALFSLLGTIYGGDGRTTFALPDLRGRVPIHEGTGPGLSPYFIGAKGGSETQ